MTDSNVSTVQSIQAALELLPESKREFIRGYAEGVLALAEQRRAEQERASA